MKTVFSLTAAAMMALSGGVSAASAFSLSSADIPADFRLTQQHVFKGFGCSGENISPQLSWRNPPAGTKSYAITVFDPDAPTGSGWWHWTMVNIPAQIHDLPPGDKPHRYQFTVWALNTATLPLDSESSGALVGFMLNAHVIAKAKFTATYGR